LDEQAGRKPESNPLIRDWLEYETNREEAKINPDKKYITFEELLNQETPAERYSPWARDLLTYYRFSRLESLLYYLRSNYFYCYYCGAAYDNLDQLLEICPGLTEEEH
jgi:hypothetical protein